MTAKLRTGAPAATTRATSTGSKPEVFNPSITRPIMRSVSLNQLRPVEVLEIIGLIPGPRVCGGSVRRDDAPHEIDQLPDRREADGASGRDVLDPSGDHLRSRGV